MDTEVWTSPRGLACELHYVGSPVAPVGDDDEGWYPEAAGELPPRAYELRRPGGRVVARHTVFPLAPWSPYDAISDRLIREGWQPPACEPGPDCEHGLSAAQCSGPMHY